MWPQQPPPPQHNTDSPDVPLGARPFFHLNNLRDSIDRGTPVRRMLPPDAPFDLYSPPRSSAQNRFYMQPGFSPAGYSGVGVGVGVGVVGGTPSPPHPVMPVPIGYSTPKQEDLGSTRMNLTALMNSQAAEPVLNSEHGSNTYGNNNYNNSSSNNNSGGGGGSGGVIKAIGSPAWRDVSFEDAESAGPPGVEAGKGNGESAGVMGSPAGPGRGAEWWSTWCGVMVDCEAGVAIQEKILSEVSAVGAPIASAPRSRQPIIVINQFGMPVLAPPPPANPVLPGLHRWELLVPEDDEIDGPLAPRPTRASIPPSGCLRQQRPQNQANAPQDPTQFKVPRRVRFEF
jgi:hypothetical protein